MLGRKIKLVIDGIESFLYDEVEEEQVQEKPSRRRSKTQKKQLAEPSDTNINYGWLIVLYKKKAAVVIKCRTGKLKNLAAILGDVQERFPDVKISTNWVHTQQQKMPQGWVVLELKVTGASVEGKLREKVFSLIWKLVKQNVK